ncbi:hypothetical protein [Hymenobacter defluvii]|uniref:Uncharacterized protein n=1 Tax=Hymenobacter defluvii TaxID=2054411 RepID=A0ABS3TEU4_9BACT|nr:hypothetical protein [Hymenobacter defluvii]MBO3272169.1 hypothetical protein [Hymenobacter defluvii]
MKGIVLLGFALVQLPAYAQTQEEYRKKYRIVKTSFASNKTPPIRILKQDTLISLHTLLTPVSVAPTAPATIETLTSTITVETGTITLEPTVNPKSIRIASGATLREKSQTRLLKVVPTTFKELQSAENPLSSAVKTYYSGILQKRYPIGSVVTYTVERKLPAGKVMVEEKITVTKDYLDGIAIDVVTVGDADKLPNGGFVKFDEDKVWVNPNLRGGKDSELHYYQLKNRRPISLRSVNFSLTALTMPVKYRFSGERKNGKSFAEDFSSAINVNVFWGVSLNRTSFQYREKVGNISNNHKFTFGAIAGVSTVTLTKSNTTAADTPILDATEITKGLLSTGVGVAYSFNKATVGAFLGSDFSIGKDAKRWDYNGKRWLGIAFGYSIFSI